MARHTHEIRLSVPFEVKASASEAGNIEGLASPFGGSPDAYGDVIAPGAFSETLAQHRASNTRPAFLWAHDISRPVGTWTDLSEESDGLHVAGRFNLDTEAGRDAFAHVRGGSATGLSIGYRVPPGGAVKNPDGGRTLAKLELLEVSLVAVPAAPAAQLRQVKSIADLESLLRGAGLARGAAKKLARGGWPALVDPDETDEIEDEAEIAAMIRDAAEKLKGAS
ncbi:MAG: HK97 family phage prohead protease [Roseovarius sp.]|nr:HK97 family phage prohead protease [Roseovarius sp.]